MGFSRPRGWHLLAVCVAYWAVLFLVAFWRPLVTYWRVSRTPQGHGTASFEFSGEPLSLALWILGPPLIFFAAWLLLRRDRALPPPNEAGAVRRRL
jgi:hypothetical protein